jgi:hypothetical protein
MTMKGRVAVKLIQSEPAVVEGWYENYSEEHP